MAEQGPPPGLPKRGAIVSVRLDAGDKVKPHHHVPSTWPAPIRGVAALSRLLAVLEAWWIKGDFRATAAQCRAEMRRRLAPHG